MLKNDEIRNAVRQDYGNIALEDSECGCSESGCCSPEIAATPEEVSKVLGYSDEDVTTIPEGANMGLGCGNPQAIADLKEGETVIDLGSGGGFDCFLASKRIGVTGKVIGIDMTPEMIAKARANSEKGGFRNVDFRLGEIENLPVADNTADAVISNCVINLSPEKNKVYNEAFRVLKSGGRLAISDVVSMAELPKEIAENMQLYSGCISGASLIDDVKSMLSDAGFTAIQVVPQNESKEFIKNWSSTVKLEDFVTSASIEAIKP